MIACLRLPYYAVTLEQRERGHPSTGPLALIQGEAGAATLAALSAETGARGLLPGMSLRAALALCPELETLPYDRLRVQRGIEGLLGSLARYSEFVEAEGGLKVQGVARRKAGYYLPESQVDSQSAATFYVDLGRLRTEEGFELAQALREALLEGSGMNPALGMAKGRFTALLAARSVEVGSGILIRPGQEAAFLAPYPAALLPVDRESLRQLELLGLRRLGQIADLGPAALTDRFGRLGGLMARLARGEDRSPVAAYRPRRSVALSEDLQDWRLDRQGVQALLTRLAGEGAARLATQGCAADRLELRLQGRDGSWIGEELALRAPATGATRLGEAAFALLLSMPLPGEIRTLELRLSGAAPALEQQLGLFDRSPVAAEQLRAALASLAERHGDCFYVIRAANPDAARPEARFRLDRLDPQA